MFGRTLLNSNQIQLTRVSADNAPLYKPGGVTINWLTVATPGSDVNVADGSVVRSGNKYLRYGQIITQITGGETDTITIGGGASGGTFTVTMVNSAGTSFTTAGIAFGASAATVQAAALLANTIAAAGQLTVTGTGAAATAEVDTITWTSPTAGDNIQVAIPQGAINFVVNATATPTATTTQAKLAWNDNPTLSAIATASGTTTFILTAVATGVPLNVTVTQTGTGTAANVVTAANNPYTFTFAPALGAITVTGNKASLTGGTPTLTVVQTVPGNYNGWYGPYDPAAVDGRQTLTRGMCYIIDELTLQYDVSSAISAENTQIGKAIEGGLCWQGRILQSGIASHSLAAGPTFAEFLGAFPSVRLAQY